MILAEESGIVCHSWNLRLSRISKFISIIKMNKDTFWKIFLTKFKAKKK